MIYDLVLEQGHLITPQATFKAHLGIKDGRIAALSQSKLQAERYLNLTGKLVFPGVVDLHVHFSEPGRDYWEGWQTGSHAAAMGGVTTVVDMPLNAIPATTNLKALHTKVTLAQQKSHVDFALWGGLVDDNLADLKDLADHGVIGFKAFMVDIKDDSFRFIDDELLFEGMKRIAELGHFLALHAEDNRMTWEATTKLQAMGRRDRAAWGEARSPAVELKAIHKALKLAKAAHCPIHIVHVSIPEGAKLIRGAAHQGQQVTFETCAHYLSLTEEDFWHIGPEAKCAPPLRDKARQNELWQMLLVRRLTVLTRSFALYPEEKTWGLEDI
ncbi:MAG: amidohydrolase family protein [Deinococcales bacterium]